MAASATFLGSHLGLGSGLGPSARTVRRVSTASAVLLAAGIKNEVAREVGNFWFWLMRAEPTEKGLPCRAVTAGCARERAATELRLGAGFR